MKCRCILLFVLVAGSAAYAQKARDFTDVVEELASKLEAAHVSEQPLRLAVVPFGNTQSQTSNKFGDYVTESIISKLSDNPGKFKIFERKRLDAILKEDELILSDLMLPEAAQKVGKLAPIDALFSGTYTKLKTYVDLNARLINVTSGEILVSFSGRVKLTKNLKSLFPEVEEGASPATLIVVPAATASKVEEKRPDAAPVKTMDEACNQLVKEFQSRLNDLSSEEKVQAVTREAMAIPFDNRCGRIHYSMVYAFTRYKIKQPAYESFLLSTLDTIAYPSADERAYEIFRFMSRDSVIDSREWKTGLAAVSRVGDYTLSTYLGYLLGRTKSSDEELQSRVEAYFALAAAGKIGLPKAIAFNQAYFEMMEGLSHNLFLQEYVYPKYGSQVSLDTRSASTVYSELHKMYEEETNPKQKTLIMGWVADYFNDHSDEKSHEHLYDFAWSFNLTLNNARNKEIMEKFPVSDLKLLVSKCRARFSEYAMKTPYQSQQEDRINFCVKYDIAIPGVIPTISEADVILRGNDIDEQLRVMKLLEQMGVKPRPLEGTLIALLPKRSLDEKEKMTEIQTLAVLTLGHMKTTSPAAIDHMVSKLSSFNYAESESAEKALAEIGKPAVMPLLRTLNKTTVQDGGLRYKIIVLLGKLGKDAKPAEPTLKKILAESSNSDVRYAIEAALQAIQD